MCKYNKEHLFVDLSVQRNSSSCKIQGRSNRRITAKTYCFIIKLFMVVLTDLAFGFYKKCIGKKLPTMCR